MSAAPPALNPPSPPTAPNCTQAELKAAVTAALESVTSQGGSGSPPPARPVLTPALVAAVLTLIGGAGATNWAVLSQGERETRAIVREELEEHRVRQEATLGRQQLAATSDRRAVEARLAKLESSMDKITEKIEQISIDVAVTKSKRRR